MDNKINDGGPAFPHLGLYPGADGNLHPTPTQYEGMSLRDWFAGQALAGLTADHELSIAQAIDMAWEAADGMIVSRQQPAKKG